MDTQKHIIKSPVLFHWPQIFTLRYFIWSICIRGAFKFCPSKDCFQLWWLTFAGDQFDFLISSFILVLSFYIGSGSYDNVKHMWISWVVS